MRLPRSSSSSVSHVCVNDATSVKPNVALPPLIECATRKIVLTSSRVGRARVELEQRGLHRVERFEALLEERVVKLREVECHAHPAPVARSRQLRRIERLDDPAGRARGLAFALAVGEFSVVSIRIGV